VSVVDDVGGVLSRFREVEVELVGDGGVDDLRVIARRLRRAGAPPPSQVSKVARALGELARRPVLDPLGDDVTVAELVAHAVRDGRERLLAHDPAVRLELGAEAVHQARVATRRLRADLRTLRPLLDTTVVEPLRSELAWLGGCLGAVRDLDVLGGEVVDAAEQLTECPDISVLTTLIDRHRADARRDLLAAMTSERYDRILSLLERAAAVPPLRDDVDPSLPAAPAARKLLRQSWKRLSRLATEVDRGAPDEQWHEVRKKAKGVRYAAELLEPFVGKPAARLAKATKQIQDELGTSNDAVNARHWLQQHATTPAAAYVAGRLDSVFASGGGDARRQWKATWRAARAAADRV
jgi:CHAD domain-containing protein